MFTHNTITGPNSRRKSIHGFAESNDCTIILRVTWSLKHGEAVGAHMGSSRGTAVMCADIDTTAPVVCSRDWALMCSALEKKLEFHRKKKNKH